MAPNKAGTPSKQCCSKSAANLCTLPSGAKPTSYTTKRPVPAQTPVLLQTPMPGRFGDRPYKASPAFSYVPGAGVVPCGKTNRNSHHVEPYGILLPASIVI